jgi:pyruvate formate lyase activating enzyme
MDSRRRFLKRCAAGCGLAALGLEGFREFVLGEQEPGLGVGFRNDAPQELDRYSRPAAFSESEGRLVHCALCPHACILGENDRGFCYARVVKGGRLYTVAYGNLCTMALDPIEKKPLYHYLPRTPVLSVAHGGCNLRCLNCQNWEISQARPHEVAQREAFPEDLVALAAEQNIPALAYTYSEPLVSYEYVRDCAALARERGVKNVLVTAGYLNPAPLRELARVIDAVTLDVKAFRDSFYREVSGGRLAPVLRALEILREEKVWIEVSFLMVPGLSDSPSEIGQFAAWVAAHLGPGTPFHILRFHPAHRLQHLPPTPLQAMEEARERAAGAGLAFVYLGNVPGTPWNHTRCPRDGRILIERQGFQVVRYAIENGRCPCGEPIPGVFA